MKSLSESDKKLSGYSEYIVLGLIMAVTAVTRFLLLDKYPNGFHQDESYSAYNAYTLMTQGMDSRGYRFPVYFTAWGDGMNVLYAYVSAVLFRIFGVSIYVYRLPQAVLSLLCVFTGWKFGKMISDRFWAVVLPVMICLCPWNVINSRWGLESNLAPGLFFIGTYFLVKYLMGSRKAIIGALVLYGLTLYAYAMTWIMVPVFLAVMFLVFRKQVKVDKYLVISVILLGLLAIPLLLFIAVNMDLIPEISTAFISVPKMTGFRINEMSAGNIVTNLKGVVKLLILQHDLPYMSSEAVGGLYRHLLPFYFLGIVGFVISIFRKPSEREDDPALKIISAAFLSWLVVSGIVCTLKSLSTTTHFNMVFFPLIYFEVYGIYVIGKLIWRMNRRMVPVYAAVLVITQAVSFGIFAKEYVVENGNQDSQFYTAETAEVIEYAKSVCGDGNICICEILTINYSFLLWHDLPDPVDFAQNAVYADHGAWNYVAEFGKYRYYPAMDEVVYDAGDVYILPNDNEKILPFEEEGFEIKRVNEGYAVAIRP